MLADGAGANTIAGEGYELASLRFDVAAREGDERRPVGTGCVAAAVLAEGDIAVDQRRLDGREFGGTHILLSEEL